MFNHLKLGKKREAILTEDPSCAIIKDDAYKSAIGKKVLNNMKYVKQIGIIGGITFAGELLNYLLPLPVPASVYGMILLFLALCIGVVKEEHIKETADFLLVLMPVMFTGPSVGVIENYASISQGLLGFVVIIVITTAAIMGVTGAVTQGAMRLCAKVKKTEKESGGEDYECGV